MTVTPAETLRLYRTPHRIRLEETGPHEYRCAVDGIRVIPLIRGDRWRHHPDDIVKLLDAEYGGPWGKPKQVIVEDSDAYVVTVDEDEDWSNREGQPEFNGSFR